MPARNKDLHGNAPDKSGAALLLIDVINDLDFEGSSGLLEFAIPMAHRIAELKRQARKHGIPCIYVNDNFGKWRSDLQKLVDHCLHDNVPGQPVVELLRPDDNDYVVIKPKHSGFYSTTLDTLLDYLQTRTLILTGMAGNICVLFTANDAYMRDFFLHVPADCTASNTREDNDYALRQIETVLKADISVSSDIDLARLASRTHQQEQE